MTDQGRWPAAGMPRAGEAAVKRWPARALLCGALALLAQALLPTASRAQSQQPNFAPLEPGDYTEMDERVKIARGLDVSLDYAFSLRVNSGSDLPAAERGTELIQDVRLHLETLFHRDVRFHLTLELDPEGDSATALRQSDPESGALRDGQALALSAREAYLRYEFNPRSGILLGKQELSVLDRRGKVFHGLVPAVTFDCRAGTWCLPFGFAHIGPSESDALVHVGLQYTAWDYRENNTRNRLQVEVTRLRYDEGDVPLGRNLGPGTYTTGQAGGTGTPPTSPDASQLLDPDGEPVYYDATNQNYYGVRILYEGGPIFVNFDVVGLRGSRRYHPFRGSNPGVLEATGTQQVIQNMRGTALEAEVGYRWSTGRLGLRALSATGEDYQAYGNGQAYVRDLLGFYEITPGSYSGNRLWFNGSDSNPAGGNGLGNSIANTRMIGLFVDYVAPEGGKLSYSGGIYDLSFNNAIPDGAGVLSTDIGLEVDNLLIWHVHKQLSFQFEANGILAGKAFRIDENADPKSPVNSFYQFMFRVLYNF